MSTYPPTHRRVATRPGFELACHVWGTSDAETPSRPVVVLLHGFLDCGMSFDPVARLLADDYIVVAPDHRGHGESDRVGPGGYYHFPDYVQDLAFLLDTIAPERIALCGHSMGASIAAYYAGAHPERIAAMALLDGIGPAAVGPEEAPRFVRRWLNDLRLQNMREDPTMEDLETVARRLQRTAPFASPARLLALAEHAATRCADGLWRWRFDPLHRTTAPTPFDVQRFMAFLREISAPTLVLRGEKSPMWEPDADARIACLQHATVATLVGAAHNLHHERPVELAEMLKRFLHQHFPPR